MSFASLDDYLNPDAFASASSNAAESGSAPATASTSTAAQTLDPALFSSTSDLLDFGNAASSSTGDSVNYADLFRCVLLSRRRVCTRSTHAHTLPDIARS